MIRVLFCKIPHKNLQVTFWFDKETNVYYPLVERMDYMGNPIKGKLLRSGAKLIQVVRGTKEWVSDNCEETEPVSDLRVC